MIKTFVISLVTIGFIYYTPTLFVCDFETIDSGYLMSKFLMLMPSNREHIMTTANHQLVARKVQFDFSNSSVHWIPNDPLSSHVVNGINLFLPAGEFWFCRVYNKVLPYVTDAKLKADVQGFIRQEAVHGRTHCKAQEFLTQNGYEIDTWMQKTNWLFEVILGEAPLGVKALQVKALEHSWLVLRVGLIAAIEHFTGAIGQWSLDNKTWDKADPAIADLFRWHLAEEVEHRSVAYDLFEHLVPNKTVFYAYRQALMAIVYPLFIYLLADAGRSLGKQDQDKAVRDLMRKNMLSLLLEFQRTATRTENLPSLTFLSKATLRWLSPFFHPEHEGDTAQALAYLAKSPAVKVLEPKQSPHAAVQTAMYS